MSGATSVRWWTVGMSSLALDELINHEWKTQMKVKVKGVDADLRDAQNQIAFRGFKGRYRLTWKDADGKERTELRELK